MSKKNQFSSLLIVVIFILNFTAYSQIKYSEEALTGKENLILVGEDNKLQKEVYEAFKMMKNEALKEGILIEIVSAYRSYNRQNKIWSRKYNNYISEGLLPQQAIQKIINYSTIPGTSRHHWGTDIDIIDGAITAPKKLLTEGNYNEGGVYSNLKIWMDTNSEKYGFYLVYNNNQARKGFKYEPWHYSFKKLSKPMLHQFLKVNLFKLYEVEKLEGAEFISIEFLQKYSNENILDINSNLK